MTPDRRTPQGSGRTSSSRATRTEKTQTGSTEKKQESRGTGERHTFTIKRCWVEIELVGEDDSPIPDEKFELTMPDGTQHRGKLNRDGWARVEGRGEGKCAVCFPDLDKEAWEYIEATGPK